MRGHAHSGFADRDLPTAKWYLVESEVTKGRNKVVVDLERYHQVVVGDSSCSLIDNQKSSHCEK